MDRSHPVTVPFSSGAIKEALERHARDGYLQTVCPEGACPQVAHSFLRDLVSVTAVRDVFVFAVRTTPQQDQMAVNWLNNQPNVNRYNGFTNNCAVFTSSLVNLLFPHSVQSRFSQRSRNDGTQGRRPLLHTLGPQAARSRLLHNALFSAAWRSAAQRPRAERHRNWIPYEEVLYPGGADRRARGRGIIPGRLLPHGTVRHFQGVLAPPLSLHPRAWKAKIARKNHDDEAAAVFQAAAKDVRDDIIGSEQDWAGYRERFLAFQDSPDAIELSPGKKQFFPKQYDSGKAAVDDEGAPWLTVETNGIARTVGISSANLLSDRSDPTLAYQLMLGRVGYALHAKNHSRESLVEFEKDWALLERSRDRLLSHREQKLLIAKSR